LIAAPPGPASLRIAARSVVAIMTLIPGYTYQLQSTSEFATWIIGGSPFLASNNAFSRVFNAGSVSAYSRLAQVR
jgi:hypothetical protein